MYPFVIYAFNYNLAIQLLRYSCRSRIKIHRVQGSSQCLREKVDKFGIDIFISMEEDISAQYVYHGERLAVLFLVLLVFEVSACSRPSVMPESRKLA